MRTWAALARHQHQAVAQPAGDHDRTRRRPALDLVLHRGEPRLEARDDLLAALGHAGDACDEPDVVQDFGHAALEQHQDRYADPLHRIDQLVRRLARRRDDDQVGLQRHNRVD